MLEWSFGHKNQWFEQKKEEAFLTVDPCLLRSIFFQCDWSPGRTQVWSTQEKNEIFWYFGPIFA